MKRVIIRDDRKIFPFNEAARELRILNKPLKVHQRDCLHQHCDAMIEYGSLDEIPTDDRSEMLVYQDNCFFDQPFIDAFVRSAKRRERACQVAFNEHDRAIAAHALALQEGIRKEGDVYVGNLWYFPQGVEADPEPLVVDTRHQEIGYYHVPTYFGSEKGDVVQHVPLRAFLSIEHWFHVYVANVTLASLPRGRALRHVHAE